MPHAILVVGLGNGDEGKGSVVDHLVRKEGIRQVVRFNGGAQALHHVVDGDRMHGFSQFGSGTFAGARTVLSRFMLFEPLAFCREALALSQLDIPDPYALVTLSARAPIIPPANMLANRILEIHRGSSRHGSCGMGIGLTQGDIEDVGAQAIYASDLCHPTVLREKLTSLGARRLETVRHIDSAETRELRTQLATADLDDLVTFYGEFAQRIRIIPDEGILEILSQEDTVCEGAQGVLLDQDWGFFPHVTRSTTTFANAETLLDEAGFHGERIRVGLLRGYATRHGAGPFPTEVTDALAVTPCHNASNPWQGAFRTGWFDAVTARYALDVVGGVDLLGLTNLDRLVGQNRLQAAVSYQQNEHFPDGKIPCLPLDRFASQQRTEALVQAVPAYHPLPSMENDTPSELFRYTDALADSIRHAIRLISARPDHHKLYRGR